MGEHDVKAISTGANPIPLSSCALGRDVFYGSRNNLLQWNVDSNEVTIVETLEGRVECVTPFGNNQGLWIGTSSGKLYKYENLLISEFDTFPKSVSCIANSGSMLIVGCMDGNVYVFPSSSVDDRQIIKFKGYALCAAICEDLIILGGTAWSIYVFDTADLSKSVALEGHENWVRSLSFRKAEDGTYILASASQEKYIRLWKFTTKNVELSDFSTNQKIGNWTISFEALLMGHDDWALTVSWDPYGSESLLSASSDSSLIIWKAEDSDLWTPDIRLGDVSQWGASTATGTSGGFWSGIWLEDRVITTTITGSWRVWMRPREDGGEWVTVPGLTGHLKDVTDVAWLASNLALTTSLDQTTRLWFYDAGRIWEVGRPQIHGYDMMALTPLSPKLFASAGDEKIMRVFELPKQVAEQLSSMNALSIESNELPDTASVPVLGLSNKPEKEEASLILPSHPREDQLQRETLWPEIDKLYGHGYEVCALAHSEKLGVIISCCKANTEQHAKLRFHDTKTWLEVAEPTIGHSLTVTSLCVSPDGTRVLSVGRDRKLMITDIETHKVVLDIPKAHSRIIWDCCFVDDRFLTVSRDKTIKLWQGPEPLNTIKLESPGTAIDYAQGTVAVGEETGLVSLFELVGNELKLRSTFQVPGRINKIKLAPNRLMAIASTTLTVIPW